MGVGLQKLPISTHCLLWFSRADWRSHNKKTCSGLDTKI